VSLRGDRASSFERKQSRLLFESELLAMEAHYNMHDISNEEKHTLRWKFLSSAPIMPTLVERDRPHAVNCGSSVVPFANVNAICFMFRNKQEEATS